jgi:hypothetical protein
VGKGRRNHQARRDDNGPAQDILALVAARSTSVNDVHRRRDRQVASLVAMSTGMPDLTPGLDHARVFLNDLADHAAQPALQSLMKRAEDDIRRGFICLVSDDGAGVNDICRDLMEVEMLFADFHRDISSLERWSTLPTVRDLTSASSGNCLTVSGRASELRRA